jgi:hypothetical protein
VSVHVTWQWTWERVLKRKSLAGSEASSSGIRHEINFLRMGQAGALTKRKTNPSFSV